MIRDEQVVPDCLEHSNPGLCVHFGRSRDCNQIYVFDIENKYRGVNEARESAGRRPEGCSGLEKWGIRMKGQLCGRVGPTRLCRKPASLD